MENKEYYIDLEIAYTNEFPDVNTTKFPILSATLTNKETMNSICMVLGKENKKLNKAMQSSITKQIKDIFNIDKDVKFIYYDTEEEFLTQLISNINKTKLLIGWNIKDFDIPYLTNRTKKILDINLDIKNIFDCMHDNNLREYSSYSISYIAKEMNINLPDYKKEPRINKNILANYTCNKVNNSLKKK